MSVHLAMKEMVESFSIVFVPWEKTIYIKSPIFKFPCAVSEGMLYCIFHMIHIGGNYHINLPTTKIAAIGLSPWKW